MIILKHIDGSVAVMQLAPGADKDDAIAKFDPDGLYEECVATKVPASREFRDAWVVRGNKVVVDGDKAKSIHLERVRAVRNSLLDELDKEAIRHMSDAVKLADIESRKQLLRDVPQQLKGLEWPKELKC